MELQKWPKGTNPKLLQLRMIISSCFHASNHITSLVVWSSWICPCTSNYIQGNSLSAIAAVLTWYSHIFSLIRKQRHKLKKWQAFGSTRSVHWTQKKKNFPTPRPLDFLSKTVQKSPPKKKKRKKLQKSSHLTSFKFQKILTSSWKTQLEGGWLKTHDTFGTKTAKVWSSKKPS